MTETSEKYSALKNYMARFLPIISIVDYFAGTQIKMKKFIKNERNPIYTKLIKKARASEGVNIVKSLVENGFNVSEEETLVFVGKLHVISRQHSN
jgi:hypothetical protein